MSTLDLGAMSRKEKLLAMEAIWADLSRDAEALDSPAWHAQALADAERSVRQGAAVFIPLSEVKERIRRVVG